MTEATLQADLQRELLKLTSLFSSGDVVIGDWSVLDGSSLAAPFVIIEVADDFAVSDVIATYSVTWQIPFTLIVRFTDWDATMLAIRDARATIIAALLATDNYTNTSGALAWGLRSISANTGISEVYDRYNENAAESLPVYLSQTMTLEVEETAGA